ncbi:DUF1491 family protein [Pseudoblastomonas halimionae]|uniref:DUF1491 family protein n=1 Tax=Alteriqipengyuania halimionae TaxID=1926630 RepID=A0A6I4U7G3_9SPHN|nr:DUF1491 family protein [Alteriqipengyuania halimionae]MXP10833.1 DUF1491 family protein [Alteriqipengyuania halimionae]
MAGDVRIPAHLEVAGLRRRVESAGGFATILNRGERDAGTILVVCVENGATIGLHERMPQMDGTRKWEEILQKQDDAAAYLERRGAQDPDLWIVELDIANGKRFVYE